MRRFTVLLLVLAAGCSGSSGPQPDSDRKDRVESKPPEVEIKSNHDYTGWKRIAPKGGAFEIRFPVEPTINMTTPVRSGTGVVHTVGIQRLDVDHLGFVCSWSLLAKAYGSRVSEDSYLRGTQARALQTSRGKLIEEKPIILNGVSGREYLHEVSPGNVKCCRLYLADKRLISLQVAGKDQEALRSEDVVKFLDSLKIAK